MKSKSQLKFSEAARRSAYRTLEGWALGVLIEQQAVTECEHHGHRRDRSDPDAWNRAREEAWRNPFPGATPEACITTLEEIMRSSEIPARTADADSTSLLWGLYSTC